MNKKEYYDNIKKTTTEIRLNFKGGIAKDIIDFSIKKNIPLSKTARFLLFLALKYNFDSNGKYIPSQISRSVPSEERSSDNAVVSRLSVRLSPQQLDFLNTCGKELSCFTPGAAAKKIITIALDHDCDDNLCFSSPQFTDCSIYKNYSVNDFICIDFIWFCPWKKSKILRGKSTANWKYPPVNYFLLANTNQITTNKRQPWSKNRRYTVHHSKTKANL